MINYVLHKKSIYEVLFKVYCTRHSVFLFFLQVILLSFNRTNFPLASSCFCQNVHRLRYLNTRLCALKDQLFFQFFTRPNWLKNHFQEEEGELFGYTVFRIPVLHDEHLFMKYHFLSLH